MKIKPIHIILAFALLIRLAFAFAWHEVWWDSGVYIGMGKYVYSGGENGLFEHIRPPLVPLILGAIWKTGLSPVFFGRLLEIILMLGIVWLTYKLAEHWFNQKTAVISSIIVSLSPIFFYLSFHQYTEIPSIFFALLALWLYTKEKHYLAGISTGLAFLAKFPAGMFIAVLLLAYSLQKKWKPAMFAAAGFATIATPYFIWSWIAYGSPLATFLAAQDAINRALGCNVLRAQPWWQYFNWLAFSETKLHFMAIIGAFALLRKWKKQYSIYAICLALPLIYFSQLHCRDYRYLTLVLPFIAILTAYGITYLYEKLRIKKKWMFTVLVLILSVWMLSTTIRYYYGNELQQPDNASEEYFSFIDDKQLTGEIWTANPIVAAYTDKKLEKIYYPIFGTQLSADFYDYVTQHSNKISAVLLDNCGGGIICPPYESDCEQRTQQLITELDTRFTRVYEQTTGRCWYTIWVSS